jgi:hypothetical protein
MRQNMIEDNRQPNYETPTDSLLWGYDCTDKALDNFLEGKTKIDLPKRRRLNLVLLI